MTDTQTNTPAPDATPALPTESAATAARDAELTALFERDPNVYNYAEGGRFANEHLALKKVLQKTDEQDGAEEDEGDELTDADAIDLDAEADDASEGEEPSEGAEASETEERTPLKPWTPPEGQEVAEHAKPHLEALDAIANDEEQRDKIMGLYQKMVEAQNARLAEADKQALANSIEALGGREAYTPIIDSAKSVMRAWPKGLRDAVRDARTSDGRRLALMPEFVRVLASVGERQGMPPPTQDHKSMLREELAAIDAAMHEDVANLYKPWRGGKLATDRKLEILRALGPDAPAKPTRAQLATEEAELLDLHAHNPQLFEYAPWRETGKTGAQRLYEIRSGRG